MTTKFTKSDTAVTYNKLSEFNMGGIFFLQKAGKSILEISRLTEIPESTVRSFLKRYEERGNIERPSRPDNASKLNSRAIRYLKKIIERDPLCTYNDLKSVIWSDESKFTAGGHAGRPRVIRKKGTRYDAANIVQTTKWGVGSIMVWGCFWGGGFGPLVFLEKNVNQEAYVNCLSKNYLSWVQELSEEQQRTFVLQEDNASCHKGSYAVWWKRRWELKEFETWPAQSPDLNPIENVWALFKTKVGKRRSEVKSIKILKDVLKEEWELLSVDYADTLVKGMKQRCKAVIKAKGGPSHY
ncbi:hypothetical protein INT46_007119 [Mucor plumbeus]|uniref:Tc1-like transposase DDE domain-containing protein n=1 Tax=Mucor plumbeus TaxID=97098 RepID=A0A8H7QKH8_9FUNG|nr:hypothetical protein INT46_007119 [Mucor plumbeus]